MSTFQDIPEDLLREAAEATDMALVGRVMPNCLDKARNALLCEPYHMNHFDARWASHLRGYLHGYMAARIASKDVMVERKKET